MKRMRIVGILVVGLTAAGISSWSQDSSKGPQPSIINNQYADAFTATIHTFISSFGPSGKPIETQQNYAQGYGKIRLESDQSKTMERGMKEMGLAKNQSDNERILSLTNWMHHSITILDNRNSAACFLYPSVKAYYCTQPSPENKREVPQNSLKATDKIKMGMEVVDGHPCTKYRFTRTSPSGNKSEITQWEANDLHGFPLKTEEQHGKESLRATYYTNINIKKVDPGLFVPPADYKRFESDDALSKAMQKWPPQ
jgi:hypothetical protein